MPRIPAPGPQPAPDTPRLRRVQALARLLDSSIPIPGTGRSIGLDPLLGLIPGFGDAAGVALSAYIILEAARIGVSRASLLRMGGNVAVEALVGAVPLVGDLFDFGWKANVRNLRLIREHMEGPERAARAGRGWLLAVLAVLAGLLLVVAGAAALAIWLTTWLLRALGG